MGRIKRIAVLAAAVLLAVSLMGCETADREKEEAALERVPLTVWCYYETEAQRASMDALIEGFNRSQGIYEAAWEYVPMTEFTKKLTMAYTEEALPDLALIDNPTMPMCIKMGMFEDLTEFLEKLQVPELYYASTLETVSYEGRMYGLPAVCNNLALIYNKKLLEEAGIQPPETWEELEEAAKVLTTGERDGFLMSTIEGEQGAFQLLPWVLSTGEPVDQIGGEGTVKALRFLNGLIEQGYLSRNCINLSQNDVARLFSNGKAAMMENGPWVFPMLEETGIDYGVCPLPIDRESSVIAGGENLGVLKGKNLEGAKLFLEYYNRDEVMQKFCEKTGGLPAKKTIQMEADSEMQVIGEQMERAIVRSSIPFWNQLSEKLPEAFYKISAGEGTPERAALELKKVQEQ